MTSARSIVVAGLLAAAALAPGCAGLPGRYDPVSVNVADLRMGTAGVFEQQYFVKLRIRNPADRELQVKGVVFDLEINGKAFAKGSGGETVTVPRFGSATVEVETVSTLTGILRQIGAVAGEGGAPKALRYRIRGRVYQSGMGGAIPFDDNGEVALGGEGSGEGK